MNILAGASLSDGIMKMMASVVKFDGYLLPGVVSVRVTTATSTFVDWLRSKTSNSQLKTSLT